MARSAASASSGSEVVRVTESHGSKEDHRPRGDQRDLEGSCARIVTSQRSVKALLPDSLWSGQEPIYSRPHEGVLPLTLSRLSKGGAMGSLNSFARGFLNSKPGLVITLVVAILGA